MEYGLNSTVTFRWCGYIIFEIAQYRKMYYSNNTRFCVPLVFWRRFTMELRELRYFVQIAQDHSYTRAAEHLYVSQPAL